MKHSVRPSLRNLEITRGQGTSKICWPKEVFVISFFICFNITGVKTIVRPRTSLNGDSLYRGSTAPSNTLGNKQYSQEHLETIV